MNDHCLKEIVLENQEVKVQPVVKVLLLWFFCKMVEGIKAANVFENPFNQIV